MQDLVERPRQRIGGLVSEQVEYLPASLSALEPVRGKYACPQCEDAGVVIAARAAGPGFPGVSRSGLPAPKCTAPS